MTTVLDATFFFGNLHYERRQRRGGVPVEEVDPPPGSVRSY